MGRASARRTAAIVIILMLAATVGIAALVGGWSFEMPDGGDEPTRTTIVTSPGSDPVQLPPFFGDDAEPSSPTSPASPESTSPASAPDEADLPAS